MYEELYLYFNEAKREPIGPQLCELFSLSLIVRYIGKKMMQV